MSDVALLEELITLSHELGREDRHMAILGEGNTSVSLGDGTFWVKASGSQLGSIDASGFSRLELDAVLELLEHDGLGNQEINERLEGLCLDPSHKRPSVEAFLHALCLTLGGARWVGHTHTVSVLEILCSRRGAEPFRRHVFPDEIVVCGRHVAVVPYIDPGMTLAHAIRDALRNYEEQHGHGPKLLLMENHGPVALGQTSREVLNIMLMADKWARVLHGTLAIGGPRFMPEEESDRIDGRPDEDYRRGRLKG